MKKTDIDKLFENIIQFKLTSPDGVETFYELELKDNKEWNLTVLFGVPLQLPPQIFKCTDIHEAEQILKQQLPNIVIY